jgi:competence protein ComEA
MRALTVALLALFALPGVARADPPRPAAAPRPAAVSAPSAEGVVNINAAPAEELERLPGVGPARAAAIVQLRERVRRFHHAEDLLRVRGIGRVGFRRLRPYVALDGATTLAARPPRARLTP